MHLQKLSSIIPLTPESSCDNDCYDQFEISQNHFCHQLFKVHFCPNSIVYINKFVELIMYQQIKTQLGKIEILQEQLKTITVSARYSVQRDVLHTKNVLQPSKYSEKNTSLQYKTNPGHAHTYNIVLAGLVNESTRPPRYQLSAFITFHLIA